MKIYKPKPVGCGICGKSPKEGTTIFRINSKGEEGIWRCKEHLADHQVDPETLWLVDMIEKSKGI